MKKIISLLLSLILIGSMLSISVNAYAAYDSFSSARSIGFNESYSGYIQDGDRSDYYRFYVPVVANVIIRFTGDTYNNVSKAGGNVTIYVYDKNQDFIGQAKIDDEDKEGYLAADVTHFFDSGEYFFEIEAGKHGASLGYSNVTYGSYTVELIFKPNISKPSNFRVSYRNTTNLGLTWNKVSDISGYQLYRNTADGWKWVANTTSNYYEVGGLKAGTKYDFRVRSYKNVGGTNYFSGWTSLATPTKPYATKVTSLKTNKKHQLIAKWNRIYSCTGYQVQFMKKKNGSVIATKTVKGSSKTSYTGKNFTKGRKYYVRVRAYKTVNGTKYYSAWSKAKQIKCK